MDNKDQRNGSVPLGTFNQDASGDASGEHGDGTGTADTTGSYERVDDLDLETVEDTAPEFASARPSRRRVRTLLGVPVAETFGSADTGSKPGSESERSDQIQQAIQNMLDDRAAQTLSEGSTIQIDIEPDADVLVPEVDLAELVDASSSAHEEFDNRPTSVSGTQLPILIPAQYADAQARDREEVAPVIVEAPPAASLFPTSSSGVSQRPLASVSSLAPRETVRKPVTDRDAAPGIGFLWVAAMALIATGGWYFTAGTFSRSNTATPPPAAAVSQPNAPTLSDPLLSQQPSAPLATQAPAVTSTPLPATTPSVASTTPAESSVGPQPTAARKPSPVGRHSLTATSRTLRTKAPAAPKLTPDGIAETPTRGEVVQRLESVRSSVRACAAGLSGVADLDITIAHSGVVTHVLVGGDFAGTTQGSCIARAVREARFSSFKQERFRLLYPYAI